MWECDRVHLPGLPIFIFQSSCHQKNLYKPSLENALAISVVVIKNECLSDSEFEQQDILMISIIELTLAFDPPRIFQPEGFCASTSIPKFWFPKSPKHVVCCKAAYFLSTSNIVKQLENSAGCLTQCYFPPKHAGVCVFQGCCSEQSEDCLIEVLYVLHYSSRCYHIQNVFELFGKYSASL